MKVDFTADDIEKHVDREDKKALKRSDIKVYGDSYLSLWNNGNDFSKKTVINESGVYSRRH